VSLLFVLKWCFILFFVLNDIPTSVFLNNLVIVLVSGPKYVKVDHFLFCSILYCGGFCFWCIACCG
jgi:hypothetical protein